MKEAGDSVLDRVNTRITSLRKNKYCLKTNKLVSKIFAIKW